MNFLMILDYYLVLGFNTKIKRLFNLKARHHIINVSVDFASGVFCRSCIRRKSNRFSLLQVKALAFNVKQSNYYHYYFFGVLQIDFISLDVWPSMIYSVAQTVSFSALFTRSRCQDCRALRIISSPDRLFSRLAARFQNINWQRTLIKTPLFRFSCEINYRIKYLQMFK